MSTMTNLEAYQQFLQVVQKLNQTERIQSNRKMRTVFFWCFAIPTIISILILIFTSLHFIPHIAKSYLDSIILFFPVTYSIYFLGTEVLRGVPKVIRGGGVANVLDQAYQEGKWRNLACEIMEKEIEVTPLQWRWITDSFKTDLDRILDRNRYITVLAGAVFFLIMEGIDAISGPSDPVSYYKSATFGLIEMGRTNFSQYLGLTLFLVLLYLSGNQNYRVLKRYHECSELIAHKKAGIH